MSVEDNFTKYFVGTELNIKTKKLGPVEMK